MHHVRTRRVLTLLILALTGLKSQAQTVQASAIHSFDFTDGADASSPLTLAADSGLCGTTFYGGSGQNGVVFRLGPVGAIALVHQFSALDSHGNNADGSNPVWGVIIGPDGDLYGTTSAGGANGGGTVFQIAPDNTFHTLFSFAPPNYNGAAGASPDGAAPTGQLVVAADGALYGVTSLGGAHNLGTIYKVTTSGSFSTVYAFDGAAEVNPESGLVLAADRRLYGVAPYGGAGSNGVIYRFGVSGDIATVFSFASLNGKGINSTGANPSSALCIGSDGALYGVTPAGGANGEGTVFRATAAGAFSVLAQMNNLGTPGQHIYSALTQGSDGALYGTLYTTASSFSFAPGGLVYKVKPGIPITSVFVFTSDTGEAPYAGVVQDASGNLFGECTMAGKGNEGTVYEIQQSSKTPVLAALWPATAPAGVNAIALACTGAYFPSDARIQWKGQAIPTTFLSATRLQAVLPASALKTAGSFPVTIYNPDAKTTSSPLSFTVTKTGFTMKVNSITVDKGTGAATVNLTLINAGAAVAPAVAISDATLGIQHPTSKLPLTIGSLNSGASATVSVVFAATGGPTGEQDRFAIAGSYTGGQFGYSVFVTLP